MQNWFAVFVKEWPVIKEAPWSFVMCIAIAATLIWLALEWFHRRASAGKDAEIASKNAEIGLLVRQRDHAISKSNVDLLVTSPVMVKPIEPAASFPYSVIPSSLAIGQSDAKRDVTEDERIFLPASATPQVLADMYLNRTSIEADRVISPYIGRLMKLTGIIEDITQTVEDKATVWFPKSRFDEVHVSLQFIGEDIHQVTLMQKGDKISAVCKIDYVLQRRVAFHACQLESAGQTISNEE